MYDARRMSQKFLKKSAGIGLKELFKNHVLRYHAYRTREFLKNPSLKNSIHITLKILKISSKNIYVQMSGNDLKIYVSMSKRF